AEWEKGMGVEASRRWVMQRGWKGGAVAPGAGGRIEVFKFSLAAEPADHIDFPAHFGHRHLGAGRGHRAARGPTPEALGKGSSSEQGTADEQRCSEGSEPRHVR